MLADCAIPLLSPAVTATFPSRSASEMPASACGTAKSSFIAAAKASLITGVGRAPRISTERFKNDSIRPNAIADSANASCENSSIDR